MKKMLIIDGNSVLYRAYYATFKARLMSTSNGTPTNAVYTFIKMLDKITDSIKPDYFFVAFDAGKKTFRNEMYSEYKSNRKPTPDDLVVQFSIVREFLDSVGIKRFEKQNVEADDIIGTLAKKCKDISVSIVSSDKDLYQLVDENISILSTVKGVSNYDVINLDTLMEKNGILPFQVCEVKALMGDKSDNIPGVPGIGEKNAVELIKKYNNVENLIKNVDDLSENRKKNILDHTEEITLYKKLTTINTSVDLPFEVEDCSYDPNFTELYSFLMKYEMKSLAVNYEKYMDKEIILDEKFEVVSSVPSSFFVNETFLAIDYTQEDLNASKLMGISLMNNDVCIYITIENLQKDENLIKWLNSDNKKISYDVKRVIKEFSKLNIATSGFVFDTMVSAFLCNSNITSWERLRHSYKFFQINNLTDLYGTIARPKTPELKDRVKFVSERNYFNKILYDKTKIKLTEYNMDSLFYDVEMKLINILFDMEEEGFTIDIGILNDISEETLNKLNDISNKIYTLANHEFNINSPSQLAVVLFDELNLPCVKKRSTSIEVLEALQSSHPIIDEIMEQRTLQKLYSTYAEGLKKYIHDDNKIHTIFNQCSAQTGRLSSSSPNLQNITVRNDSGREIRKAFIPSKGNVLLAADYSQIELRILAHMAKEQSLIDAFNDNIDIHAKTASDIFGVSIDEVSDTMRRQAKAVNFGIVYGMSEFGLAKQLMIGIYEAGQYIETYFKKYPKIKQYMDDIIKRCMDDGCSLTILNRRRKIHEIKSSNKNVQNFGKRAAMNAPIQGSAADLIKIAMINISEKIKENKLKSKMILQVHDELIFDVVKDEVQIMKNLIEKEMASAIKLSVPLVAECKEGKTWFEVK
ncbi:MAG: DNA polymerase I [Anaerorhabdus sp.]